MDISFELYKVFYYVASTLSFSEASRQLYISQSAVSQSIKSLEQKLGHKHCFAMLSLPLIFWFRENDS